MLYIARSCHFKICVKKNLAHRKKNLWQNIMNNYKHLANSELVVIKAVSKTGFQMFFTDSEMMCFDSLLIYIIKMSNIGNTVS